MADVKPIQIITNFLDTIKHKEKIFVVVKGVWGCVTNSHVCEYKICFSLDESGTGTKSISPLSSFFLFSHFLQ